MKGVHESEGDSYEQSPRQVISLGLSVVFRKHEKGN